jgi:hypothetical protein
MQAAIGGPTDRKIVVTKTPTITIPGRENGPLNTKNESK